MAIMETERGHNMDRGRCRAMVGCEESRGYLTTRGLDWV